MMIAKQIDRERGQATGGRKWEKETLRKSWLQLQRKELSHAQAHSFCSCSYFVVWTGLWKRTSWFDWDFEEVFMCLYSLWQLKPNIYKPFHVLYPLSNLRHKGNFSYCSYNHQKKSFTKAQFDFGFFFAVSWQKIFWPRSFGSGSAISHGGTLKLLKQSFEDFSGSEELPVLAGCHSACSLWHTGTLSEQMEAQGGDFCTHFHS